LLVNLCKRSYPALIDASAFPFAAGGSMSVLYRDVLTTPTRALINWFGNQCFVPRYLARPRSEEEAQEVVRGARALNLPIRAKGAMHSTPPLLPTSGIVVDLDHLNQVISLDKSTRLVTVGAGMRVGEVSRYLATQGLSLNNQGDIDTQAIAGAISTATHGAGKTLPCMSAQMVAARIVTAEGEIRELSAEVDGECFRAFRTSLGMFGLILSVTLQAVEGYNILKKSWNADTEDCIGGLHHLLEKNRTFWFFWLPRETSAELFELPGGTVPSKATRASDFCHMRTYNPRPLHETVQTGPGEAYGPSSVIYPNLYKPNFREIEYAVPFARFEECFEEIRGLFKTRFPDNMFPVECRAVKSDDSFLSAYAQRDGYALSVSGSLAEQSWPMLMAVDEVFDRYDGRPHWGKHHFMSQSRLERIFPLYDEFKRIRRAMDPDGIFLNDHMRALFA
jgi:FAD/FMN-containing dehydrogenase